LRLKKKQNSQFFFFKRTPIKIKEKYFTNIIKKHTHDIMSKGNLAEEQTRVYVAITPDLHISLTKIEKQFSVPKTRKNNLNVAALLELLPIFLQQNQILRTKNRKMKDRLKRMVEISQGVFPLEPRLSSSLKTQKKVQKCGIRRHKRRMHTQNRISIATLIH